LLEPLEELPDPLPLEELPELEPLEPPDPDEDEPPDEELPELADESAALYMTDRMSISIFLMIDLTSRARSTSSCPVVENLK
jgi:hypothetical protein